MDGFDDIINRVEVLQKIEKQQQLYALNEDNKKMIQEMKQQNKVSVE